MRFVKNQLAPQYITSDLVDIIDLALYPLGTAKLNTDGTFNCPPRGLHQYRTDLCYGNKLHVSRIILICLLKL